MKKKEALNNLKFTGKFFIIFGMVFILGTIIFWKFKENLLGFILDIGFGSAMCFFGWLILSSRKALA